MKTHTHAYIHTCTHSYTNKNTYLLNIKHIFIYINNGLPGPSVLTPGKLLSSGVDIILKYE